MVTEHERMARIEATAMRLFRAVRLGFLDEETAWEELKSVVHNELRHATEESGGDSITPSPVLP